MNPFDEAKLHLEYQRETRRRIGAAVLTTFGVCCAIALAYMAGKAEYKLNTLPAENSVDVRDVAEENYRQGWNDACDAFHNETPFNLRQMADERERELEDNADLLEATGVMQEIEVMEAGNPFENYR